MAHKPSARCQIKRDFTPISWQEYFDEAHDVHVGLDDSFRVYLRNFRPPLAPDRNFGQVTKETDYSKMTETEFYGYSRYPTIVMLHGGGYSGLTWSQFTRHVEEKCPCRLMAIDLRGHGDTKTKDEDKMDSETLVNDITQVIEITHRLCGFPEVPRTILIGHSMGGALAIRCAARSPEALASLVGFVIIDVVEGTAKDALPVMMNVIKTRPLKFPSVANAIEWSVRSGHLAIHDLENSSLQACCITKHKFRVNMDMILSSGNHKIVSLPPNLPQSPRIASLRANPDGSGSSERQKFSSRNDTSPDMIEEEEGISDDSEFGHSEASADVSTSSQVDDGGYRKPPTMSNAIGYCWRTDLAKTQPHWPGWFEGLSEMMLEAPVQGKFLLLAGIDRLDKTLTIGQMQGKFMMRVLPKCGHAVHEDSPERVASVIAEFLIRNKFTTMDGIGETAQSRTVELFS